MPERTVLRVRRGRRLQGAARVARRTAGLVLAVVILTLLAACLGATPGATPADSGFPATPGATPAESGSQATPAGSTSATAVPTPAGSALPAPPSSLDDAFDAAHPGGALPPGLTKAGDASRATELLAARGAGGRILLPAWLPPGYGLAAPYVAVGSGAALPNPFVWDDGYRVSYTDGRGLIVVHVGSGRLPGEGSWLELADLWHGNVVRIRSADGVTTVASRRDGRPVAVAVVGPPQEAAQRVLRSLER